jgi:hypothetical protein
MPSRNGVRLNGPEKAEETIKKANERFEIISSATNDAIFELDFISGKAGIIKYLIIIRMIKFIN